MKTKKSFKSIFALLLAVIMLAVSSVSLYAESNNDKDDTGSDPFDPVGEVKTSTDFEDGNVSMFFANDYANVKKSEMSAVKNPLKDTINSSDTAAKITVQNTSEAGKNGNNGIYLLSSNFLQSDATLYSVNFKVLLECDDANYNYRYPTFVYDYKDKDNWRGIALRSIRGKITAVPVGKPSGQNGYTSPSYSPGFNQLEYRAVNSDSTKALPFKTWVQVSARYSKGTVKITLVSEDGYMQLFNQECALSDSPQTRIGFTHMSGSVYIDDLDVNIAGNENSTAADLFLKKHSQIFNYRSSTISNDEAEALDSALADWSGLSDEVKTYIPESKVYFDELKAKLNKVKDNDKYTHISERPSADYWSTNKTFTFEDSFDDESSLSRYIDVKDTGDWLGDTAAVSADNAFSSSAVSLRESAFRVKDELLPEKARMQTVDFDFYVEADTPLPFYANAYIGCAYYYNSDNYLYTYLTNMPDDKDANEFRWYRSTYGTSGTISPYGPFGKLVNTIDPNKPIHVQYQYGDKSTLMVLSQGETVFIEKEFNVCDIRGQFALAGCAKTFKCWYDNLKITYIKGDWDEDTVQDGINVYFSGSTYQAPGDAVLISGENLGNVVTDVEVMPYTVSSADRKYYDYLAYNTSGVVNGTYSADPSAIDWVQAKSVAVSIVQTTEDSVKFVLPKKDENGDPMPQGIYAVRITGIDENTNKVQKTLLINAPNIDYTVGDDGKRVSQGGYIEVVGKNLVFPISNTETNKNYSNLKALLVNKNGAEVKELGVQTVFSNYNVRLSVPQDTPKGEYELWLYSGYGWSVPYKITVDESVEQTLLNMPQVNVLDNIYTGTAITGSKEQNVTPNVQKLLDVLGGQGGGVLYFPKGIYRFTQPIIVPENVSIVGESTEETIFIWTSFNWAHRKLPTYLIGATQNTVIKNLDIYVHRTGGVISFFGKTIENVYIDSVRTFSQRLSGTTTSGGHSGSFYTITELQILNATESMGWTIWTDDTAALTNFQLKNSDFNNYASSYADAKGMRLTYGSSKSSYYQIYDTKFACGWSPGQGDKVIVRNFDFSGACFAITGRGVLYDNNYIHDDTTNNRELFVADLSPSISKFTGMYKDTSDTSNKTYFLPLGNRNAQNLVNMQIYVVTGQGSGQTRIASNVEETTVSGVYKVTLDSAFTVEPNRNSGVIMRRSRESMYFTGNRFYNGSSVGYYGGVAGVVFDSNTYQRVGGQYLWACWGDVDWYASYNNEKTIYDPYYIHSDGTETGSGFTSFKVIATQLKYVRSVVFRNCDFSGRYLLLDTSKAGNIVDLLVDNCSFTKSQYGVYSESTAHLGSGIDGVLFHNLIFNSVDEPYKNLDNSFAAKNSVYDMRALILDDRADEFILGDVNLDGEVTLKDCTLLRMYLADIVTLNEEQLKRSDVNNDGKVNLKDCGEIRVLVVAGGGKAENNVTNNTNTNNTSSDINAIKAAEQAAAAARAAEAKKAAEEEFKNAVSKAIENGLTKDELISAINEKYGD